MILEITKPMGICIDDQEPDQLVNHPDASLLTFDQENTQDGENVEIQLYSHLLRSNCPVTGQPDWGTVLSDTKAKKLVIVVF